MYRLRRGLQRQDENGDSAAQDHGGQGKTRKTNETNERRGQEERRRNHGPQKQSKKTQVVSLIISQEPRKKEINCFDLLCQ